MDVAVKKTINKNPNSAKDRGRRHATLQVNFSDIPKRKCSLDTQPLSCTLQHVISLELLVVSTQLNVTMSIICYDPGITLCVGVTRSAIGYSWGCSDDELIID